MNRTPGVGRKNTGRPYRTTTGRRGPTDAGHRRDGPARHRALAEELIERPEVGAVSVSPSGVTVELFDGERLPAFVLAKARLAGVGLHVEDE